MFVGTNVSEDRLDLYLRPSSEASAVAPGGDGLEGLVARLRSLAPALVVLEAAAARKPKAGLARPGPSIGRSRDGHRTDRRIEAPAQR